MKKALITGITGQDGSYLAELLLGKGYIVHGVIRRASSFNTERLDPIYKDPHRNDVRLFLHYGDLADSVVTSTLIAEIQPDEIYNLAAQSHVRVSFDIPEYTGDVTAMGTTRILEVARKAAPKARFYQASSSEMFGLAQEMPQRESTAFYPRSPYGAAKVYSYWMTVNYRESYNLHASNGILRPASTVDNPAHAREDSLIVHGRFYGRVKFCCKTAQFCATRCQWDRSQLPSGCDAVQRRENSRKNSFLN